MEKQEYWKSFLNKYVKIVVEDPPSPYPKSKEGLVIEINDSHIILDRETKIEALRLSDIRRIEIRGEPR